MLFCEVAVDYPRNELLIYKIEESSFARGRLVDVPLGRRKAQGCLLRIVDSAEIDFDTNKIKEISKREENDFTLPSSYLDLYSWMSRYYPVSYTHLTLPTTPYV